TAKAHWVLQEPGRSHRFHFLKSWRRRTARTESSWSLGRRRALGEKRKQARGMVPPSEGNEARREERREVGASHSTCEAGEPGPRGPCCPETGREGDAVLWVCWEETCRVHRNSISCQRDASR